MQGSRNKRGRGHVAAAGQLGEPVAAPLESLAGVRYSLTDAAEELIKLRTAARRLVALWVRQRTAPAHELPDDSLWAEAFTELADLAGSPEATDTRDLSPTP